MGSSLKLPVLGARRGFVLALLLFAFAGGAVLLRFAARAERDGDFFWTMCDFRSAVYFPALAFLHGDDPYDHRTFLAGYPTEYAFPPYLPATLVLNAPFALLGYDAAAWSFFASTIALTLVTAVLAVRLSGAPPGWTLVLLVAAIMTLSRPGRMNLLVGQETLVFVIGVYLAVHMAERSPALSGFGLALAFLKPTFGIPLCLLMLAEKRLRPLLFAATIGVLVNLPPLVLVVRSAGGIEPFIRTVTANYLSWRTEPVVDPAQSVLLVSAAGVLSHLIGHALGGAGEGAVCIVLIGMAVLALRMLTTENADRALATTVVSLAVLTAFHHQPYDLLLLTLPCVALLAHRLPEIFYKRAIHWPMLALLAVLAFNYAATPTALDTVHVQSLALRVVAMINGLVLLALFVAVVGVIAISRRAIVGARHVALDRV